MLEDQLKTQYTVVMLQCGIRGQGKTTKMCSILRWALDNDACSKYWLIAPSFSRDANSGYNWLKQPKYRKVRVLTDYTPLLSEYLYKRKKLPEKGTLLCLDDLSANRQFPSRAWLFRLVITNRYIELRSPVGL